MKVQFSVLVLLNLICNFISAQINVDCASHRFDQEVFSTVNVTSAVHYGANVDVNGNATDLTFDLYEPAGDTMQHRPVIVWAHGGSFLSGTKNDVDVVSLSQHFAKRGYVCISINYRLGIAFPYNSENATNAVYRATQDMKAAIRFLRKDASSADLYKIDSSTIFAGGSSAGAFTALHLAYLNTYAELPATIDTSVLGDLEGNSGNSGYSSEVNAVIDLCGALGNKTWVIAGDIPFVAMHGDHDGTVPYATAMITLLGAFPLMVVDGSYSISDYANTIGVHNEMYTYFGADHVPFVTSAAYMDTTVRFVSNFLFRYLGCSPVDPSPAGNTFTTGFNSLSSKGGVFVYPNPGSGVFTFRLSDLKNDCQLFIYDFSGRRVKEFNHLGITTTIDLADLDSGVYFYSVQNESKFISGKLMKD